MNIKVEQLTIPLLRAFIFGIASIDVHATAHLSGEVIDCSLCSTNSDSPADVAGATFELKTFINPSHPCEHPPTSPENEAVQRLFARGPPQND